MNTALIDFRDFLKLLSGEFSPFSLCFLQKNNLYRLRSSRWVFPFKIYFLFQALSVLTTLNACMPVSYALSQL